MLPDALTSFSIGGKLGKLNNEVQPVLLDQIEILCIRVMVLDGVDLDGGHTNPFLT